jgi:hypothetical protein
MAATARCRVTIPGYGDPGYDPQTADDGCSPVPGDIGGEHGNTDPPLFVDIAGLLDRGLPDAPEPEFLRRADGQCLFYAGQVNLLFGDPESGKTLVALAACSEALQRGRKVGVVDIDHNGPVATVCRLIDMGVDESILRDPKRFRYVEPEDRLHLAAVVVSTIEWNPQVVTVDSIGELLPLLRLSSNSPDDFTAAHARVLKPLAMAGAAVIAIDHLPKNLENKQSGPTGTAAKRRAVGGVAIRVVIDQQFTPGKGGKACLTINKDRHGALRRACSVEPGKEPIAGWFKISPKDDCISWSIEPPTAGDTAPADRVDPRDLARLEALEPPPTSVRDVKKRCTWRTDRAMSALAEWRSRRSPSVPGEQGTAPPESVPVFPTYVPGNGEHDEPHPGVGSVGSVWSGEDAAQDNPTNQTPSWSVCDCGNQIFDHKRSVCGRCINQDDPA